MKIIFLGDSITDANRERQSEYTNSLLGYGFVMQVAGRLYANNPIGYEILNKGISGNRIVDLYARIKSDVWNEKPDVLNILVGVNDIWHEIAHNNGVDIKRFENIYRLIIEETKERLPDIKIILCEPVVLKGSKTEYAYERFLEIKNYARVVEKLAKEYNLPFLPLQNKFDDLAKQYGEGIFLRDGVHPTVQGSVLIADEWLKLYNTLEGKSHRQ